MPAKKDKYYYFYHISRYFLGLMARILFNVKVYKISKIPDAPYIVASNHTSYLDPPLIGFVFRKDKLDFMAKRELFESPVLGAWFSLVRCIEVRRGENPIKGLRRALDRIKKEGSIAVFPEGTRSSTGDVQEGKVGTAFIAYKARVPVIPVYIEGALEAMPKEGGIKMGRSVNVYVDEPIMPAEFASVMRNNKDYPAVADLIMERIGNLKNKYKNIASKG